MLSKVSRLSAMIQFSLTTEGTYTGHYRLDFICVLCMIVRYTASGLGLSSACDKHAVSSQRNSDTEKPVRLSACVVATYEIITAHAGCVIITDYSLSTKSFCMHFFSNSCSLLRSLLSNKLCE
jgi:hypothetical protein